MAMEIALYLFLEAEIALWWDRVVLAITTPLLGLFGNFMTILLCLRPRLHQSATSGYLIGMAIMDSGVLIFGILMYHLPRTFWNYKPSDIIYCKLAYFLPRWCGESSSWILACMSVERCIAVSMPLISKRISSKRATKGCITAASLLIACYYIYPTYLIGFNGEHCFWRQSDIYSRLSATLDYTFLILGPTILIIGSNIVILTCICMSRKNAWKLRAKDKIQEESTSKNSTTILLVAASLGFLVLKTPLHILLAIEPTILPLYLYSQRRDATIRLVACLCIWLQYTNHSINFYLYTCSGRIFRDELAHVLRRIWKPKNGSHDEDPKLRIQTVTITGVNSQRNTESMQFK